MIERIMDRVFDVHHDILLQFYKNKLLQGCQSKKRERGKMGWDGSGGEKRGDFLGFHQ